jgi:predicted DNA-binding protein
MKAPKKEGQKAMKAPTAVRASISFPSEMYQTLEGIAKEKKVSLAWIVREGMEQYISDKWPLFKGRA